MKQPPSFRTAAECLFLSGIGLFFVGKTQEIVYADSIEGCQPDQNVDGVVQNTNLILRVGVLTDTQILADLLLRISVVDPQVADVFKFQDFIAHLYHPEKNTIS